MEIINTIIVDDDEIDRLVITSYVRKISNINLLGTFSCPQEALYFINASTVDLLFP